MQCVLSKNNDDLCFGVPCLSIYGWPFRKVHFNNKCALVDVSDRFHPVWAEAARIELAHLLWVRCAKQHKKLTRVEQAFKATDILLHHGEFKLIIVDLSRVSERQIRKVSLTTWHRFSRAAERASATLIFLTSAPVAQSCANMKLHIMQKSGTWTSLQQYIQPTEPADLPHTQLLSGIDTKHEVVREKLRKPIQNSRENLPPSTKRA